MVFKIKTERVVGSLNDVVLFVYSLL